MPRTPRGPQRAVWRPSGAAGERSDGASDVESVGRIWLVVGLRKELGILRDRVETVCFQMALRWPSGAQSLRARLVDE